MEAYERAAPPAKLNLSLSPDAAAQQPSLSPTTADAPLSPQEISCPNSVYGCAFRSLPDEIDAHLHSCEKQKLKELVIHKEAEVIRLRNELHIKEAELTNYKNLLGQPKPAPSKILESLSGGLTKAKTDISDALETIKKSEAVQISKQKSVEAGIKIKETFQSWGESAAKKFEEIKESDALQNVGEKVRRASIKVKESVRRASNSASDMPSPTSPTSPTSSDAFAEHSGEIPQ